MLRKRKSIIGLDIGTSEVKAVELTDFGDAVKISGFGSCRIQPGDDVAAAISNMLAESGIKSRKVVTSVSGRSVIVRYITLPYMSPEELSGALGCGGFHYPFALANQTCQFAALALGHGFTIAHREPPLLPCGSIRCIGAAASSASATPGQWRLRMGRWERAPCGALRRAWESACGRRWAIGTGSPGHCWLRLTFASDICTKYM